MVMNESIKLKGGGGWLFLSIKIKNIQRQIQIFLGGGGGELIQFFFISLERDTEMTYFRNIFRFLVGHLQTF